MGSTKVESKDIRIETVAKSKIERTFAIPLKFFLIYNSLRGGMCIRVMIRDSPSGAESTEQRYS
jgi:hypothetical protein